jgi:hypothetical protein
MLNRRKLDGMRANIARLRARGEVRAALHQLTKALHTAPCIAFPSSVYQSLMHTSVQVAYVSSTCRRAHKVCTQSLHTISILLCVVAHLCCTQLPAMYTSVVAQTQQYLLLLHDATCYVHCRQLGAAMRHMTTSHCSQRSTIWMHTDRAFLQWQKRSCATILV